MTLRDQWARLLVWLRIRKPALPPPLAKKATRPAPVVSVPVPDLDADEDEDYQMMLLMRLDVLQGMSRTRHDSQLITALSELVASDKLEIPRMPTLALQLMALDPDGPESSYQIADLIRQDRDVTACVMDAANAARFGAPAKTLELAVVRLGLSTVKMIAMGASAHKVIYKIPGYNEEAQELAETALACARTCQALARRNRQEPGAAFLAGLFHDVGKVLILRALSQLRTKTRGTGRASELLIRRLNQQLHVPLGAWFSQVRGLPPAVREAIMFHHEPIDGLSGLVWAVQALQAEPHISDEDWEELAPARETVQASLSAQHAA